MKIKINARNNVNECKKYCKRNTASTFEKTCSQNDARLKYGMFKFVNNTHFVWNLKYRENCFGLTSTHQLKQIAIHRMGKSNNEHILLNKSSVLNITVTRSIHVLTSATVVVFASGTTGEFYTSCNVKSVWVANASYTEAEEADAVNLQGSTETF